MVVMALCCHLLLLHCPIRITITTTITIIITTIIITTTTPIWLLQFHPHLHPTVVHLQVKKVGLHLRMVHLTHRKVLHLRKVVKQSLPVFSLDLEGRLERSLILLLRLHQICFLLSLFPPHKNKYSHQHPATVQFQYLVLCLMWFLLMSSRHQRVNQIQDILTQRHQLNHRHPHVCQLILFCLFFYRQISVLF